MKKLILAGLVIIAVGGGLVLLNKNKPVTNNQHGTTLYYGDTCPHCKDVEKFLQDNPIIGQKVQIDQKEVNQNRDNAEALVQTATSCGIDTSKLGVPFLVDNGKCYMGKEEVINQLKSKAGINQ